MRSDAFITNDSGAYSILSSSVLQKAIDDQRENDAAFVEGHEVILATLVGDDSFVVRVVVGEDLTAAEKEEWIARVVWPLKVPCGKLIVSGGYDPDVLNDFVSSGREPGGFVARFDVPPGEYTIEILTYLNTMNGRVHRERWGDDGKLGAWFRKEHPDRAFPSWVAVELVREPEEDPGHEALWKDLAGSVKNGQLKIDLDPLSWVGVVLHLRPRNAGDELTEMSPDGFFADDEGLRRPERFPLGIPTTVNDQESRSWLRDILPK
jgi:hypothetical protein